MVPFDDTRLAIVAAWGHEWHRLIRSTLSSYISVEGDYTAVGGGLSLEFDTPTRAWTFTVATGAATDRVGRSDETTPAPLTEVADDIRYETGNKNVYDFLLGATHILNKRTKAMVNYSYSTSLGYHTDPYKILSIADEEDTELTTVFENRPDSRTRNILFTKLLHETRGGNHIDINYRFHTDDWNLNSHTVEFGYGFTAFSNHVFKPFVRVYQQEAADFYTRTINYDGTGTFETVELPEFASSDVRLAKMLTTTIGTKYQILVKKDRLISLWCLSTKI